jgi:predicted kinase
MINLLRYQMQPKLFLLIGIPASGKSTYAVQLLHTNPTAVYVSTDFFVEKFARRCGKTYNEVFKIFMPHAIHLMMTRVHAAAAAGRDIVWDQTNLTSKSRAKKLRILRLYEKHAIVFVSPPDQVLRARLRARVGKSIPDNILTAMQSSFEYPALDEGFDSIIVQHAPLELND